MNKKTFAIVALATVPILTFAQQTENNNEDPSNVKKGEH